MGLKGSIYACTRFANGDARGRIDYTLDIRTLCIVTDSVALRQIVVDDLRRENRQSLVRSQLQESHLGILRIFFRQIDICWGWLLLSVSLSGMHMRIVGVVAMIR